MQHMQDELNKTRHMLARLLALRPNKPDTESASLSEDAPTIPVGQTETSTLAMDGAAGRAAQPDGAASARSGHGPLQPSHGPQTSSSESTAKVAAATEAPATDRIGGEEMLMLMDKPQTVTAPDALVAGATFTVVQAVSDPNGSDVGVLMLPNATVAAVVSVTAN